MSWPAGIGNRHRKHCVHDPERFVERDGDASMKVSPVESISLVHTNVNALAANRASAVRF